MSTSAVPAVLDALMALVGSSLPGVSIFDGPVSGSQVPGDALVLASSDDGTPAIYATQDRQEGLGMTRREEVTVVCRLRSWTGETDIKARRDRCGELLAAVETILRDDPRLGGVAQLAQLGPDVTWTPAQTAAGAQYSVTFSITVLALL